LSGPLPAGRRTLQRHLVLLPLPHNRLTGRSPPPPPRCVRSQGCREREPR
jgi:hypothetical protein